MPSRGDSSEWLLLRSFELASVADRNRTRPFGGGTPAAKNQAASAWILEKQSATAAAA